MSTDLSFYKNFRALTTIQDHWAASRWRKVTFDDVYNQLQRCVCVLCSPLILTHSVHARRLYEGRKRDGRVGKKKKEQHSTSEEEEEEEEEARAEKFKKKVEKKKKKEKKKKEKKEKEKKPARVHEKKEKKKKETEVEVEKEKEKEVGEVVVVVPPTTNDKDEVDEVPGLLVPEGTTLGCVCVVCVCVNVCVCHVCVCKCLCACVFMCVSDHPLTHSSHISEEPPPQPQVVAAKGKGAPSSWGAQAPLNTQPATTPTSKPPKRTKLVDRVPDCKCTGHRPANHQGSSSSSDVHGCSCRDCRCLNKDFFGARIY